MEKEHLVLVRLGYNVQLYSGLGEEVDGDVFPLRCLGMDPKSAAWALAQFLRFVVHNEAQQEKPLFVPMNDLTTTDGIAAVYTADIRTGALRHGQLVAGVSEIADNPAKTLCPEYGISFVDLRNPAKPKYCFLFADDKEDRIQRTPLSVTDFIDYFSTMYTDDMKTQSEKNAFVSEIGEIQASIRGFRLMDDMELCDAYPQFMLAE